MVLPTSALIRTIPVTFQPITDPTSTNLEAVRDARGDINAIRMLLKGNVETCLGLFRGAVEEGDVVTQIQLSHALKGMELGKDSLKDFSSLVVGDLEEFSYYPKEFALFDLAYARAMGSEPNWEMEHAKAVETFRLAADRGYLPAFLELKHQEWRINRESYGFAVELRPFLGKGDKLLDYYFGLALRTGCQVGSALYYEGIYWMHQSGGISVKCPGKSVKHPGKYESFERFKKDNSSPGSYRDFDGFRYVGPSEVLAPSIEVWEAFVIVKLENVRVAPLESYLFSYNPEQIKSLLNEYKVGIAQTDSFIKSPTEGHAHFNFSNEPVHGFYIYSLSIYIDHRPVGKISVQEDTFKISNTVADAGIKPVIEFIENVMKRSGSARSAVSWLRQMGSGYI